MALYYPLTDQLDLDLSMRGLLNRLHASGTSIQDSSTVWDRYTLDENSYGGSAKLTWRQGIQSLVVGLDYDHVDVNDWIDPTPYSENPVKVLSDKWGIFLNDVIHFRGANLTFTPGVRYDRMRPVGDFTSPSLGVTWNPTEKITMRAYGAHGYSLPLLVPEYSQEKVWTVQTGFETTQIPYLWLKGTYFLNYLSKVDGYKKYRKQGVEVEGKTVPVYNTSLSLGYTFIDQEDRDTGKTVEDSPRHLLKLGVHYDDRQGLRGALLGRYVDWNSSADNHGRYSAVIWDLNLAKRFRTFHGTELELFFNAHNLFNGSQYDWNKITNTRRWFEGGLKFEF
jgi:vitamin B12 transporter